MQGQAGVRGLDDGQSLHGGRGDQGAGHCSGGAGRVSWGGCQALARLQAVVQQGQGGDGEGVWHARREQDQGEAEEADPALGLLPQQGRGVGLPQPCRGDILLGCS